MTTLIEDLRGISYLLDEPQPEPLPPQDSRVGEAAAAQVDMQAMGLWRNRRMLSLEKLAEMLPDILNELELANT